MQGDLFSFQDMIHIADTKVARRYGDFFIRQIHKFEEVRFIKVCTFQTRQKSFEADSNKSDI